MQDFAEVATEPNANLTNGIGAAHLAKEHRNELGPRSEALGGAFGAMPLDDGRELIAREVVQQLIAEAGGL